MRGALPIAWFVSPHGFGHATRSAAVIEELCRRRPEVRPEIFTSLPHWLFEDSLDAPFRLHPAWTDVGLAQKSSLEEDPAATADQLERFLPLEGERVESAAARLRELGCRLVVADISPLGIAAARVAGIPSILIESFTWDWIYRAYLDLEPRLEAHAEALAEVFAVADLRIQTEPVCRPVAGAERVAPVARRPRSTPESTRRRLEIDAERPALLLTMGGVSWRYDFLERLQELQEIFFVVFSGVERPERSGNLLQLPDRSPVFLPDLIAALDGVVGKIGYGTTAECYGVGQRYAFVSRSRFPESPVLASFVERHLPSMAIAPESFAAGGWLADLPDLLGRRRPRAAPENGAGRAAELVVEALPLS